jgi:NAD(P)-dependent dehydrogenase (short-subunit alcohol dehydrogenase family)
MGKLQGKVALVFGAGTAGEGFGNGKAAAVLYVREGARVVAVDRNAEAATATAQIIHSEGGEALALTADVARGADVRRVVAQTLERHGRIDVLHNNVGMSVLGGLEVTGEELWDTVMAVNVKGMFLACQQVVPVMVRQGGGAIVNISAIAGVRWLGKAAIAYATSKGAVNSLTQAIAQEYAKFGVRCNAILPGFIDTPVGHSMQDPNSPGYAERMKARLAMLPMGRAGDAWDIARAALFLACDESRYVTGVLLAVDGGVIGKVV